MYKHLFSTAVLSAVLAMGVAPQAFAEKAEAEAAKTDEKTTEATKAAVDTKAADAKDVDTQALAAKLKPLFGTEPDSLKPTPVPGVYEAGFGMELIYVSQDGRYFFSGDMIDGETRKNLSEDTRSNARMTKFKELDADKAISFKAKGDEKHVLSVFTDIDCPFCVKMHNEVPKLNELGVTVNYYGYPRAGVGSGSHKKLVNVWCSDDQQQAMTDSKGGKTLEAKECETPIAEHFTIGRQLGVTGTPALITDGGMLIPGYRPAAQLAKMLDDMKSGTN